MRSWRGLCLLALLGTLGTPLRAQSPAVPSSRLAWTMRQDASGLTFAVLIDGTRSPLAGASCTAATDGTSACEAPIPAMAPGVHALQIIGILTAGGQTVESAPSLPLSVSMLVVVTPENVRIR